MIGDLKEVGSVLQKAGNIELYQKILEVQEKLLEYHDQNQELKTRVKELEEALKTKQSLRFEKEAYYAEGDPHPFCSICYDKDQKLIRMKDWGRETWFCIICNGTAKK